MSYLHSKDKKCHNRRKDGVVPIRRKPLRARDRIDEPAYTLDPISCDDGYRMTEHGCVPEGLPFRDDAKDRKQSWLTWLWRKGGL